MGPAESRCERPAFSNTEYPRLLPEIVVAPATQPELNASIALTTYALSATHVSCSQPLQSRIGARPFLPRVSREGGAILRGCLGFAESDDPLAGRDSTEWSVNKLLSCASCRTFPPNFATFTNVSARVNAFPHISDYGEIVCGPLGQRHPVALQRAHRAGEGQQIRG